VQRIPKEEWRRLVIEPIFAWIFLFVLYRLYDIFWVNSKRNVKARYENAAKQAKARIDQQRKEVKTKIEQENNKGETEQV